METQSTHWLTQPECSLTTAALHPSVSIFYSVFFYPSLPRSSFFLPFSTLTSCFLSSSLPQVLSSVSPPLFLSPHVLLSLSVQHLCRLELVGPRQKVFLYIYIFVCVEQGREGRQHPGTPDQHFLKICGDLGTDLLLQLFASCLFICFFYCNTWNA